VYSTTGLEKFEIVDEGAMICAEVNAGDRKWPRCLGLYLSAVIALTYLRRNRAQAELAETYGVSQATVSRAVSAITPLLGKVLKDFVPTAEVRPGPSSVARAVAAPPTSCPPPTSLR
jgi:hypothetical protein